MAEFKWHLMADEVPEYGERDYLIMGHGGGLKLAKGYKAGVLPLETWFYMTKGGRGREHMLADKVKAWAEIPPLEVSEG